MELSKDQENALNRIITWYAQPTSQYITLGGYAGTGKTTLIAHLRNELKKLNKDLKVAFCSFTGRATQVLKNRLVENKALYSKDKVSTIHGLIYTPIENDRGVIIGWEKKDEVLEDLIIVDESSMINEEIWNDLISFKKPIIAVGDHGQLPPIHGTFNLMENPIIRIEKIHRQEINNPIIKLSFLARTSGTIPITNYKNLVCKYDKNDPFVQDTVTALLEDYNEDTIVLCGYNSTRNKINQHIRQSLGFETLQPVSGDRVICLRNNPKKGIFNGMLGTIKEIFEKDKNWYETIIKMDDNEGDFQGLVYKEQFGAPVGINFTKNRALAMQGDLFDFGYALTVHKAQGSQAKKIILFEERFKQTTDEMWKKWLYTGVTRAVEELHIIG